VNNMIWFFIVSIVSFIAGIGFGIFLVGLFVKDIKLDE